MSIQSIQSIQSIREPVPSPGFCGWVSVARESVATAAAIRAGSLTDDQLAEAVSDLTALESQVTATKLRVLSEAQLRRVAEETGDTGTDAWAARLTGTTRGVMAGGIWLARLLEEKYDATREAFGAGRICEAQVRVIVGAGERLPDGVSAEQRARAEAKLVAKAVGGMDARRLRHAARRMLEVVSCELADQLETEERSAEQETWLTLHDNCDGTFSGRFVIPELHAALLRTALERLSAPRRLSRNKAGNLVNDPTLPG